jgi:glycosyltransferase involved in cell wall biosynthesis
MVRFCNENKAMKILVIGSYAKSLTNFRGSMLRAFRDKGHDVVALAPDYNKEVEETLSAWGVQYVTAYINRTGTNPLQDIRTLLALRKAIKQIQPDIVFNYTIKPVIYGSIAAGWCGTRKVYSMITGLGWVFNEDLSLKGRLLRNIIVRLYRYAARKNNGLIFQNPDDRRVFVNAGIVPENKTHRIYGSGVDVTHFACTQPPESPIRFLFIGRLIREKGLMEYIEACRFLKQKYPDIKCDILGRIDTNPGGIGAEELASFSAKKAVSFHGQQNDVRPFLQQSSVFVLPSYYGEGTPRTALEAMATGRPLVMADSPGCRETVVEGENGFLVPVKDPVALARAMEKFIKTPNLIAPMGKKSRKIAEEKYDVHKVNQDIIRILGL